MEKKLLSLVLLSALIALSSQSQAQTVRVGSQGSKSVSKARSLALTNTAISVGVGVGSVALFESDFLRTSGAVLAVYGLTVGPSTGNFYAGDYARGMMGVGLRAAGAFLMADATSEIFGQKFANTLMVDEKPVSISDTKILIGGILMLGSIAYNVITAKKSVERYNRGNQPFSMNVTPAIVNDKVTPVLTAQFNL
jgi:hypothetical protein